MGETERGVRENGDGTVQDGRKGFFLWGEKPPRNRDFDKLLNFWTLVPNPLSDQRHI